MRKMNEIPELEGEVFKPVGLINDPYTLNLSHPEMSLERTNLHNEWTTNFELPGYTSTDQQNYQYNPNPIIALEKTYAANEYVTEFLQDYSWGVREIMRMSGYDVPIDTIVTPNVDFGTRDLPQSIEEENGRWAYKGIAMEITRSNGGYNVDVNSKMAEASKEQFTYKVLHEYTHAILDAYGLPLENHDLQVEQWIDTHAANALGKPELVETSKYIV